VRHRPCQRPCDVDARRGQVGAAGDPDDLRGSRRRRVDHGEQVDDRAHAGCRGRDRVDHHDPDDARGLRPADDQPREPRSRGRGAEPDPERRPTPRRPHRPVELVRVRWPEHRPDLPPVGRMTDAPDASGTADTAAAAPPPGAIEPVADLAPIDAEEVPAPIDPGDASLLALVDRLGTLLDRSDLSELAVEAGGTRLVLRKASAIAAPLAAAPATAPTAEAGTAAGAGPSDGAAPAGGGPAAAPARPSVTAPLTGVWYGSPAPGSAPFVAVGREVAVGQVVGLIEAMKLFNEIKSDLAGRVVRIVPENGALVKAKQPLIEVEPL